jgi:S1-C subfamily serine protease
MKTLKRTLKLLTSLSIAIMLVYGVVALEKPIMHIYTDPFVHKVVNESGRGTAYHAKHNNKIYLVTNNHMCSYYKLRYVKVKLQNRVFSIPVKKKAYYKTVVVDGKIRKVLKVTENADLCLLEPFLKDGFRLGNQETTYSRIFTAGHPGGRAHTVKVFYSIAKGCDKFRWLRASLCVNWVLTDASSHRGSSGSPVFNLYGEVIGTIFAGRPAEASYYAPTYELIGFIEEYEQTLTK